jgi:hypothetical protein
MVKVFVFVSLLLAAAVLAAPERDFYKILEI